MLLPYIVKYALLPVFVLHWSPRDGFVHMFCQSDTQVFVMWNHKILKPNNVVFLWQSDLNHIFTFWRKYTVVIIHTAYMINFVHFQGNEQLDSFARCHLNYSCIIENPQILKSLHTQDAYVIWWRHPSSHIWKTKSVTLNSVT